MVEAFTLEDYMALERLGYIPMLSISAKWIRRQYIENCIKYGGRIKWVTVSVYSEEDIRYFRILKKLFGLKISVYSPLPTKKLLRYLGREIDLLYVDTRAQ